MEDKVEVDFHILEHQFDKCLVLVCAVAIDNVFLGLARVVKAFRFAHLVWVIWVSLSFDEIHKTKHERTKKGM